MSHRRIALAAAAAGVAVALAGCAVAPGAEPAASAEQAPPIPATATATEPAYSPAVSRLPNWPTGPEIVASDPSEWDDLTLCLNRTLLVPEGYSLTDSSPPEASLQAAVADVRRMLLAIVPEQVSRLQLDRAARTLTVVPAAGGQVTEDDLRTAFSALMDIDFDPDAALSAVAVAAPNGPSFAEQCAMYAHVDDLMQPAVIAALPEDAPRFVSLGHDLERGLVSVGVTDPDASEFADLAAQTDLVDLHYSPEMSLF